MPFLPSFAAFRLFIIEIFLFFLRFSSPLLFLVWYFLFLIFSLFSAFLFLDRWDMRDSFRRAEICFVLPPPPSRLCAFAFWASMMMIWVFFSFLSSAWWWCLPSFSYFPYALFSIFCHAVIDRYYIFFNYWGFHVCYICLPSLSGFSFFFFRENMLLFTYIITGDGCWDDGYGFYTGFSRLILLLLLRLHATPTCGMPPD